MTAPVVSVDPEFAPDVMTHVEEEGEASTGSLQGWGTNKSEDQLGSLFSMIASFSLADLESTAHENQISDVEPSSLRRPDEEAYFNSAQSSHDEALSEDDGREEVQDRRRTYQRPWTAGASRHAERSQPVVRQRPASAKLTSCAGERSRAPAAQKTKSVQKRKQKERESGWNQRFGVSQDVNSFGRRQTTSKMDRPLHFTLGKEQKKKTGTAGLDGKLLPWLDPKKQLKRKPLVSAAPYMLPRRKL